MEEVEKDKKEAKVRTSITISPDVLAKLRTHCESKGVSVSSFIEKSVIAGLSAADSVDVV
ncbi:hypothetical protein HC928_00060 [bacterium]|nr:hypothetical protein [bacterium]